MKKRGVIGVDVGGTSVSVGIITETAEVIEVIKYAQVHTKSSIWTEKLIEKIEELRQKNYQDVEIIAIGIGSRGHVDFVSQKLISSSLMEVEKNFDLCRILKERFEIPVYIDNDVKAAASGELFFGIGKKYRNFKSCYLCSAYITCRFDSFFNFGFDYQAAFKTAVQYIPRCVFCPLCTSAVFMCRYLAVVYDNRHRTCCIWFG